MFRKREGLCYMPMVPGKLGEDDIDDYLREDLKRENPEYYNFKAVLTDDAIVLNSNWGLNKDNRDLEPEKQRQMYEILAKKYLLRES